MLTMNISIKKIPLLIALLSLTSLAYSDEKKSIATSFYPLAYMSEQIVGDKADVINMAGSVDVHAYEPSPKDLVKLNKADLVVFQGAELEPWTEGVIPDLKAKGVATLEVKDDHKDEHDEHHHGEFDPHTWLDPVLAQQMVDQILTAVVAIDSKNESVYKGCLWLFSASI